MLNIFYVKSRFPELVQRLLLKEHDNQRSIVNKIVLNQSINTHKANNMSVS